MENDTSKKAKEISGEISKYLEEKYGEKFVVAKLVSDYDVSDAPTKAYAYPEGIISDGFTVKIHLNKNTGVREYSDGYGFIFAENTIIPAYQALIAQAAPNSRVSVMIKSELDVTRSDHKKNVSFEEFTEKEYPFDIYVNVFISADVLSEKDDFLENLSRVLNDMPGRSFYHHFQFVFIDPNQLNELPTEEYKRYGLFEFKDDVEAASAYTKVGIAESMTQPEILIELKLQFTGDMELSDGISENEIGGEQND